MSQKAASEDPLYFAIVDRGSGVAAGYASYLRITPAHRVIEVGNLVFTRRFQRTAGATEAKYLMARSIFSSKNEPGGGSEAIRRQASFLIGNI